jgi:hypothetical protein
MLLAERTRELLLLRESFEEQLPNSEVMKYVSDINGSINDALSLSATALKERREDIVKEAQGAVSEARSSIGMLDEYILKMRPKPLLMIDRLSMILKQYVRYTLDQVISAIGIAACDRTIGTEDNLGSLDYLLTLSNHRN